MERDLETSVGSSFIKSTGTRGRVEKMRIFRYRFAKVSSGAAMGETEAE